MTHTVIGVLADELGLAYNPLERTRARWSTPASEIRTVQAPRIPVDRGHDGRWIGEIVYLERHAGNVWAVGEVDAEPTVGVGVGDTTVQVETPMYWSAERISTPDDRDIILRSVALTAWPARVSARPLTWYQGGLDRRGGWVLDGHVRGLVARAGESRHTRHGMPLLVHDTQPPGQDQLFGRGQSGRDGPSGPLMLRSSETLDVHEQARTIELIVMPYGTPTRVPHKGRMVTEIIAPGAFDGIAQQSNRIRVNRDHQLDRTVGVATGLDPHDPRGLIAEVRIAQTDLGDETLALAADDCLDASAAFGALDERWQGRSSYIVTRAWLGHIALTPDPAYVSAKILAVRERTTRPVF